VDAEIIDTVPEYVDRAAGIELIRESLGEVALCLIGVSAGQLQQANPGLGLGRAGELEQRGGVQAEHWVEVRVAAGGVATRAEE